MAVEFPFITAFLCERVLFDQDKLVSAIRIIDLFNVPENSPDTFVLQFFAVISLRVAPPVPDEQVRIALWMRRVSGEREQLPGPPEPFKLQDANSDPSSPGGVSLVIQLNVIPKNLGTCYIEVEADGKLVTKIPFTIRRAPTMAALTQ
jgi:hypothetical protein